VEQYNIESRVNYRQALEKIQINIEIIIIGTIPELPKEFR
jgi:hypothetical protein